MVSRLEVRLVAVPTVVLIIPFNVIIVSIIVPFLVVASFIIDPILIITLIVVVLTFLIWISVS